MADMSAAAVSARLRYAAQLLAERGFVPKGVDMSPGAVTNRLRSQAALSTMCQKLAALGSVLRVPPERPPR